MVAQKSKRKIEYNGNLYYWFIQSDEANILKIHVLSSDKKMNLEYPLFDREVPVTPAYVKHLLDDYFKS